MSKHSFKEVFKEYKKRLVFINSRNSSYFLSSINPKRHFDLVSYLMNSKINIDINAIINKGYFIIKQHTIDKEQVLEILFQKQEGYQEEIIKLIPIWDLSSFEKNEKMLLENKSTLDIRKMYEKEISRCEEKYASLFKSLKQIINSSRQIEKDLGKNDLYLGYPFIEGKHLDGSEFRAPLILYRISLSESAGGIKMTIYKEETVVNPVFLLSYANTNETSSSKFDFAIEFEDNNHIQNIIDLIISKGVNIKDYDKKYSSFQSLTKEEYRKKINLTTNVFDVKNQAVLGIFPISSRNIYNELEKMSEYQFADNSSVANIIYGNGTLINDNKTDNLPSESGFKNISPLDYFQRIVLNESLKGDMVIEGPPGTGKSQTIVNILLNMIESNKKVLVVSEKVAAIDVIYDRLSKLKEHTVLVKDYITSKIEVYEQIKNSIEALEKHDSKPFSYENDLDKILDLNNYYHVAINKKDYYNGFNLEEVLRLTADFERLMSILTEIEISKAVDFFKTAKITKKSELLSVFSFFNDGNFKKDIAEYLKIADYEVFKAASLEDILLIDTYKDYSNKNRLYFDYYLKTIKESLSYHNFGESSFISAPKDITPKSFLDEITNIYLKREKLIPFLVETEKYQYQGLPLGIKLVNVIENWNNYKNEKKRLIDLKTACNPDYKKGFLQKVKLDSSQEIIFEKINDYLSTYDLGILKEAYNSFFISEIELLKAFYSQGYQDKNILIELALSSNLYKLKSVELDAVIKRYNMVKEQINLSIYAKFKYFRKIDLEVFSAIYAKIRDYEDFIILIELLYIPKKIQEEAKAIFRYFSDYSNTNSSVKSLKKKKEELSEHYVYSKIKNDLVVMAKNNSELNKQLRSLKEAANSTRKRSLKAIFERYEETIFSLFSVFLMTPESVSGLFLLKENIFDYVIFDEASQMFIERAIPSIFRSQKMIVAGDTKQLRPSSTFLARIEEDDFENIYSNEIIESLEKESLLDTANVKIKNSRMLKFHYRSEHKELIDFSSAAFYNGDLVFASFAKSIGNKAIKTIDIDGIWNEKTNEIEAQRVVELVLEILDNRKSNESLGIITFNINQRNLIEEMLLFNHSLKIKSELNRIDKKTGEDQSLFVKNIENVQGDERDIIIFSIGYGKNKQGKFNAQFGTLNHYNGENRLNVAITRAKKSIYIVKSFKADTLNINVNNKGPFYFKEYLKYAEYISSSDQENVSVLINRLTNEKSPNNKLLYFDASFMEEVHHILNQNLKENYVLIKNYVVGSFKVDIAVFNSVTQEFLLGIECDGARYGVQESEIEMEYFRKEYLESRGYEIYTIFSSNWNQDKEKEIQKIRSLLRTDLTFPKR